MTHGELVHTIKLDRLPDAPVTITASAAQRAALAARFDLPAIHALQARIDLSRDGPVITARGSLVARFDQLCAIAEEPFANRLDEPLAIRFTPASAPPDEDEAQELDSEGPDEIEYEGLAIDLGEAVAQSFGLAIDPYATGPDAAAVRDKAGIVTEETVVSGPFAALAALKDGLNS